MDKTQADAVANAILEPDLRAQEELRLKRARNDADLARKRRIATVTLVASSIGAVIAYFLHYRFTQGIVWGGLAGALVGWLVTRRAV